MSSYTPRSLLSPVLISISLLFNPCHASESIFGDLRADSDAESTHTTSAPVSAARLAGGDAQNEDEGSGHSSPNHASIARFVPDLPYQPDISADEAPTEAGDVAAANGSFTQAPNPGLIPTSKAPREEFKDFVTVGNTKPEFAISDGMYRTLNIPESSTPYTKITLIRCVCFNPIDPASFQNNPELTHLIFTGSHLNFSGSEEKIGEGCLKLAHIDLRGTPDMSVDKDAPITPERFAQLIHPDVLLRILSAQCELLILNPERDGECYTVDEMKAKFLRSVVELRSAQKSQEGIYQRIMAVLAAGINEFDPTKVAGFGVRAAIKACTGI